MSLFTILLLSVIFVMPCGEARSGENRNKTFQFEGYAQTDSLEYSAEKIKYFFDERKVILIGNASMKTLGLSLKSHQITYYDDYNYLEAVGEADSTGTLINTPVFTDKNGEELRGKEIKYNITTEEGYVSRGRTEYEKGYMGAEVIKRTAEDTLFIANGTYTTCELEDNPHYYFSGKKMKFIINEKLIIKPIIGYIHDIPVFWFPFYVFPIKKGRQSGFLAPRYGSSRRDGRYFSNLGYYFAPSDYYDYKIAGSLRERNGWLAKNWLNYNKTDMMRGSLYGSFEDRTDSKQWRLRLSHSHSVSPTLKINGNGSFASEEYSRYNSRNMYERLNRNMRSSFSVTKRWKDSGNSLVTSVAYNKDLGTKNTSLTAPDISFRTPSKLLFGSDKTKNIRRKYVRTGSQKEQESWYNSIYYSFNTRLNSITNERENSSDFTRKLNLSASLSSSRKFRGWLVTKPSLRLNEEFSATNRKQQSERYERLDNLSMGLSLGTTIYGMFKPALGNLTALRHVITPNISY
ncbi:LPS-assembly protein LptD, partial [Candidatus Latescibacterota bacterium]